MLNNLTKLVISNRSDLKVNIKFKKFGLSPDDIQQMKNYGILPDKRTLQSLSKAYNSINPSIEDIIEFQDKLGFKVDTDYVDFLLRNNGGIPSKVRIKGNKIVIDHFLSFKSDYKLNSIIDIYSDFQQYGLPIAKTPSGDSIILSSDGKVRFFNHNIDSIDEEVGVIANNFLELLEKLY